MRLHKNDVLARARERGYDETTVHNCIARARGDMWIVDIDHPAYPKPPEGLPQNIVGTFSSLPEIENSPPVLPVPQIQIQQGPLRQTDVAKKGLAGTKLKALLKTIGIVATPNCSCNARGNIMDARGDDWCSENIPLIVDWLREEATKRKLPFLDFAGTLLVKRAISLSRAEMRKQEANESPATDRADS